MTLTQESRVSIQRYKLYYEELEDVRLKFEEGTRDLNAHLEHFKRQLSEDVPGQVKKFEEQFYPSNFSQEESLEKNHLEEYNEDTSEKHLEEYKLLEKPKWAKKLFRSIVLVTHPDKCINIPVDSVREKFLKCYNLAVQSYDVNNFSDLLFVGWDIGIEIEDGRVQEFILPKLKPLEHEIVEKKSAFGFQWRELKPKDKMTFLTNYLKIHGYVFSDKEVKEVIEKVSRIKRKVGTRPVNYIRKRLK